MRTVIRSGQLGQFAFHLCFCFGQVGGKHKTIGRQQPSFFLSPSAEYLVLFHRYDQFVRPLASHGCTLHPGHGFKCSTNGLQIGGEKITAYARQRCTTYRDRIDITQRHTFHCTHLHHTEIKHGLTCHPLVAAIQQAEHEHTEHSSGDRVQCPDVIPHVESFPCLVFLNFPVWRRL